LQDVTGEPGNLTVSLNKHPRYVNPEKCTGCGECANVCPVSISNPFNMGLDECKAVYRLYPQAVPSAYAITKLDKAPCTITCPAHINVQGYIQLIKSGKFAKQ
jgi:heterodisulfide reductase subunit A-like polyferredoxin